MKPSVRAAALLTPLLLASAPRTARAQDWPHWRGPNHDGSTTVTGLPKEFDQQKNVLWSAELPGPAAGTPIVLGSRVYVSSVDEEEGLLLAICFDRETGEELWVQRAPNRRRPEGAESATRLDQRSNYAAPSPVADGERAVFFFGNGDLAAYDPEGEELWVRNLQEDCGDFQFQWTFAASPTLFEGRLFVQVLQRDEPVHGRGEAGKPSFLLAIDPETGATIYRHVRPSAALRESLESYATPIPRIAEGGRKELLIAGGDALSAHDPADGKELWRWGAWNPGHREVSWRLVPSPVAGAGRVLVCAPKGAPVYALHPAGEGALEDDALAWKSEGRRDPVTTDVPSPLFYQGNFFVLSDLRESLSRVDPATGAIAWSVRMPGKHLWRASPTGADGRIWCMNHHGDVVVLDPADGHVLHQAAMGGEEDDGICSTIAVAHRRLFIRTNSKLFCIGS